MPLPTQTFVVRHYWTQLSEYLITENKRRPRLLLSKMNWRFIKFMRPKMVFTHRFFHRNSFCHGSLHPTKCNKKWHYYDNLSKFNWTLATQFYSEVIIKLCKLWHKVKYEISCLARKGKNSKSEFVFGLDKKCPKKRSHKRHDSVIRPKPEWLQNSHIEIQQKCIDNYQQFIN